MKTRSGKKLINDVCYVRRTKIGKPANIDKAANKSKKTKITLHKTVYASAYKMWPVKRILDVEINNGGEGIFTLDWRGTNPEGEPWKPTKEPYSHLCDELKKQYYRNGVRKTTRRFPRRRLVYL